MQMTQPFKRRITLGAVAVASLAAGMVLASRLNFSPATRAAAERESAPALQAAAQVAPSPVGLPGFNFVKIAEEEKKFVVNINTTKTFRHRAQPLPHGPQGRSPYGDEEDFFERFFGQMPERDLKQQSLGSGFIVDKEGYILTNNHVVDGADDIRVTLLDGRSYAAEVRGRDPKTDIALIRIKPENGLPVATLGDSDALQVGEWVVAIGNPFGFGHTVTAGVVSAKDRTIGAGPYDAFIQTDASINPGNSGGPLFNARGEVVGINSAIIASGQGIGFAIPINMAKSIMEQLREKGSVTRGWLGVQIQALTPELRETLKLSAEGGALVAGVIKGDPADKAGVKSGDVIVEFDGRAVRSDRELVSAVGNTPVGRKVSLKVLRDGKDLSFEIKIARRSDEKDEAASSDEPELGEKETGKARLGVRVQDLTKELAEKLGLDDARGALVGEVVEGSPAERAGIERGDVILEVNRKPVEDAAEFAKLVRAADPGKTQLLLVRSGGGTRFVTVKPEAAK
jgi:serine protease Do